MLRRRCVRRFLEIAFGRLPTAASRREYFGHPAYERSAKRSLLRVGRWQRFPNQYAMEERDDMWLCRATR